MMVQQQELLKRDLRCRLAVPSVYVSWFYISGHWDPDALARWNTVIPTCRLVYKGEPPAQRLLLEYRTGAGKLMVKLGLVSSNG